MWQQFTGEIIAKPKNSDIGDLEELRLTRMIWSHAKEVYKDALYYHKKVNLSVYFFFRIIGKAVRRVNNLAFSRGGRNTELAKKTPIIGVSILGEGEKAYPYELFSPGEIALIEDRIGNADIVLIFNGFGAYAYRNVGLELNDNYLVKGAKKWKLNGKSLGEYPDLNAVHITEHAYWYLW
ncbi:MAG: DUF3179 domain-containing (seleno)protein, partial [Promethearchaeota archaeon]